MSESQKPIRKFRAGHLEIAVWANEIAVAGDTVVSYSCTMKKTIKVGEDWKETNSLFANELPIAMMLLNKAYQWIYVDRKNEGE